LGDLDFGNLNFGDPCKLAICTLPLSLNFGDFLYSNPSQIGDFQILVIYNLDFGDLDFGDVLLGPKHHQNQGITVHWFGLEEWKLIIFQFLIFESFWFDLFYVKSKQGL